jgi:enediyne biosynthesis protein E4
MYEVMENLDMKQVLFLLGLVLFLGNGCDSGDDDISGPKLSRDALAFKKKANTGVDFVNHVSESEKLHHFIWDAIYNGGGVAVGDLNNDGLKDLYFCANYADDKIYLNRGNFKFEDVTAAAGLPKYTSVSSGVVMVDINQDGFLDIYISKFGYSPKPEDKNNELYINNGDMTFTESAAQYGIANTGYTIQSTFFDYNKDGLLDLYVMNQPSNARATRGLYFIEGADESSFLNDDTSDCLYRNNGDNTFTNVSEEAGIRNFAYGLGVVAADVDGDGWTDVFIANDYFKADLLYLNQKDGTFSESALSNLDHMSNFSMGADIEDLNNDGLPDIASVDMAGADHYRSKTNMPSMNPKAFWSNVEKGQHYQYMHNAVHVNQGGARFADEALMMGLAKTDWSWSILINDYDNDTHEDIYITNGIWRDVRNNDYVDHTIEMIKQSGGQVGNIYAIVKTIPSTPMSNYMFVNDGHGHFDDKAAQVGLGTPGFSNGAAYADLDDDGDLDLIVNNVNAEADIYESNASEIGNSLRISFVSSKSHRPTLNTVATVYAGELIKRKELLNARGYMSGPEAVLHFGLGDISHIDSVIVTWPDNNESVHKDLLINKINIIDQDLTTKTRRFSPAGTAGKYFSKVENLSNVLKHEENIYDAFSKQILLPYEPSELGPFIASGDLNGDKLDDLVMGGASGQSTSILFQKADGSFDVKTISGSAGFEDMGVTLFDSDSDGDLDLFVCSGGYEFEEGSVKLEDRLYINNGKGGFRAKSLNVPKANTGKSIVLDFDQDGDSDLFVFGRVLSGRYPFAPDGYLLENDGKGNFADVTKEKASFLKHFGAVTDVDIIDIDGGKAIVAVGEWMTPRMIKSNNGTLSVDDIAGDLNGLWFSVKSGDLDGDGDADIVLGNIGKNIKFKASTEKPFKMYAGDFDKDGKSDIVLASYFGDKEVPVRGKQCSSEQMPELKAKFTSYESFANASLSEIYDLEQAELLLANTLESGVLWNEGGNWKFEKLPVEAQVSPINAIEITDINNDGVMDIVICGNLYAMEVETTRLDAGKGLLLLQENRSFKAVPPYVSGMYAKGDAKDMVRLTVGGKDMLAISMNNDYLQFHEVLK